MSRSALITLLIQCMFVLPSCKHKIRGCTDPESVSYTSNAETDDGSCSYAGTGGNAEIAAVPQFRGMDVISTDDHLDSAFVKFNTQNSPGLNPNDYDMAMAGEEGENHVHIPGLKPGKYYIMVTGFDTISNKRLVGAIPYILKQEGGEAMVTIQVTSQ